MEEYNVYKKSILIKLLLWFITIVFLETSFALVISKSLCLQLFVNVFLIAITLSLFFTLLTSLFKEKTNTIISIIILLILGILFATQAVFHSIFKVYFSIYDLALQDQLGSFIKETVLLLIKYSPYILLFMLPLILFIIFHKKTPKDKYPKEINGILLTLVICSIIMNFTFIEFNKNKSNSTYELINNVNNISLSIKKLGVLNTYSLEMKRLVFGFTPKKIKVVKMTNNKDTDYEPNILDLELNDTGNPTIDSINAYVREDEPTYKNEYTGMFKDYNLVYITAESFSEIGVSKELTPTLYKMINNGFIFNNYYTPNNLSTIGGEMQSLTGLYPDYSTLNIWRSGGNSFPYGLGYTFRNIGYNTYAYHDNDYTFQNRDNYIASQGFTNFLACGNGLEQRMNCDRWPESDVEMMDATMDDYINSDKPFLAYYMTVSGHFEYSFDNNYISYKNRDLVSNLNLSEDAEAYVATQIELDRALERLIQKLKENNKLDKTVFVLMADHYPYELADYAIDELSTYPRDDIEINHNALIIWNNKLEKEEIEKPCMSIDVIPTVYNLFGIDYDSRLFTGRDILSNDFGIAIMNDNSWVTEEGTYYSSTSTFNPKKEVADDYVTQVNQLVNNRLNIARLIMENNYYAYVK